MWTYSWRIGLCSSWNGQFSCIDYRDDDDDGNKTQNDNGVIARGNTTWLKHENVMVIHRVVVMVVVANQRNKWAHQ